ncbi:MAG: hypothetical protein DWQ13_00005, partial [Crenarchaeota archaeon]
KLSENLGLNDVANAQLTTIKLSENLGLQDNFRQATISLTENLGLNDNVNAQLTTIKLSENLGLNDVANAQLTTIKLSENLSLQDNFRQATVSLTENLGLNDVANAQLTTIKLSENLGLNDVANAQLTTIKLSENLGLQDNFRQATISLTENLGFNDAISVRQSTVSLTEKLGLSDTTNARKTSISLTENLGIQGPQPSIKVLGTLKIITTPRISGAVYNIGPNPFTGTGILSVTENNLSPDQNATNGVLVIGPVPLGVYNITMTSVPGVATNVVMANQTFTTVGLTVPFPVVEFVIVDEATQTLSTLPPTNSTSSPSLSDSTLVTWKNTFSAKVISKVSGNTVQTPITSTDQLPRFTMVGTGNTAGINTATGSQKSVQLTKSFDPLRTGPAIISEINAPAYTMNSKQSVASVMTAIVASSNTAGGQFVMPPPITKIPAGKTMIMPVQDSLLPSTGGVSKLQLKTSTTLTKTGSPTSEWLLINSERTIPAGSAAPTSLPAPPVSGRTSGVEMFFNITSSFEANGVGTDWSKASTFAEKPKLTVKIPKTTDSLIDVDSTYGCQILDAYVIDHTSGLPTWVTESGVSATAIGVDSNNMCIYEMTTNHFSCYGLAHRKASATTSTPSGPGGAPSPGSKTGAGAGGAGGAGGAAAGPGFGGVIGPLTGGKSPATFNDVRVSLGGGAPIDAANPGGSCADNFQTMFVTSIVQSPISLKRAELRFVQYGQSTDEYTAIKMKITNSTVPQQYEISASIPWEFMYGSPALKYWIHVLDDNLATADSEEYIMSTKTDYTAQGNLEFDVVSVKAEGTNVKPIAYFTNLITQPIAGAISLLVDGKVVYTSKPYVFESGQSSVPLSWDIPKVNHIEDYQFQVIGEFCGQLFETEDLTFNSFPRTVITTASEELDVEVLMDKQGEPIARAASIYASNTEDDSQFKVVSPDGVCVIGSANECLVKESTFGKPGNLQSVTLGEQVIRVRYSGPDNVLERFTITSVDPISGNWRVYLESNTGLIPEAHATDNVKLKIQYRAQQSIVSTAFDQSPIQRSENIVEFGGTLAPKETSPGIKILNTTTQLLNNPLEVVNQVYVDIRSKTVSASQTPVYSLSNESLDVYGLVLNPVQFDRAELRFVTSNLNLDEYSAVRMNVEPLPGNPAYSVISASVPWAMISEGPEVFYWIHLMGDEILESKRFMIRVSEQQEQESLLPNNQETSTDLGDETTLEDDGITPPSTSDSISEKNPSISESETTEFGGKISEPGPGEIQFDEPIEHTSTSNESIDTQTSWIITIVVTIAIIGMMYFQFSKIKSPVVIIRYDRQLMVEKFVSGTTVSISVRNYSNNPIKECQILCNGVACKWNDDSIQPKDILPGQVELVKIENSTSNSLIVISSENIPYSKFYLESMNGVSIVDFSKPRNIYH